MSNSQKVSRKDHLKGFGGLTFPWQLLGMLINDWLFRGLENSKKKFRKIKIPDWSILQVDCKNTYRNIKNRYWAFNLKDFNIFSINRYGDKTPVSVVGRIFAVLWILVGITIFNMFTATIVNAMDKAIRDQIVPFTVKGKTVRWFIFLQTIFLLISHFSDILVWFLCSLKT